MYNDFIQTIKGMVEATQHDFVAAVSNASTGIKRIGMVSMKIIRPPIGCGIVTGTEDGMLGKPGMLKRVAVSCMVGPSLCASAIRSKSRGICPCSAIDMQVLVQASYQKALWISP